MYSMRRGFEMFGGAGGGMVGFVTKRDASIPKAPRSTCVLRNDALAQRKV